MHRPPDPDVDQVLLNQQSYDAIARQWQQARLVIRHKEQRCLDALMTDLKPGDTILDLGCGTGQPIAAWFIDHGLHVTGIDQSAEMLALARILDHLLPGGRLMLTSGGSADAAFTDTMFEHRFFYDSLSPDTLQSVLEEIGFHIEVMDVIDPPTTGRDKGRIAIVARTTRTAQEEI